MKTLRQPLAFLATLCTAFGAAQAHHSFAATFDGSETIDVEGVVTEFSFRNPHVLIYFDVTNEDGSVTNWVSEGSAANLMRRSGWDSDTFQPGHTIRVSGNPTHDGSPMISMDTVGRVENGMVQDLSRNARRGGEPAAAEPVTVPLHLSDGTPNLTGSWTQNFGARRGGPPGSGGPAIPFSAAGQAAQDAWEPENDPQIFCDPPGLARQAGMTPHPVRIIQKGDHVVFEWEEYGGSRTVYLSDELPAPGAKSHLGDAVARYEGDTLVIESVNLLANPANPQGTPVSDEATIVERYTRSDDPRYGAMITVETTITDPVYLTEPWTMTRSKVYSDAYRFIENDCRPPLRERG